MGDYDNDGDLDVLASGQQTSGSTRELRIYKNLSATANTGPTSPDVRRPSGIITPWGYQRRRLNGPLGAIADRGDPRERSHLSSSNVHEQ